MLLLVHLQRLTLMQVKVVASNDCLFPFSVRTARSTEGQKTLRSRHLRTFAVFALHEAGVKILKVPAQGDRSTFAVFVGSHSFLPLVVMPAVSVN